jgi:hypothetical protein
VKPPAADELAAIAIALATVSRKADDSAAAETRVAPWSLAMRRPDLEFDELLALRHACSIRS